MIISDNNKAVLSVYNHRFDRQKWNCVIPKETKLTSIAVSSVAAGSQNNSSHGIPVNPRFLCVGTAKGHVYCWCLLTGALLKIFKAHLQKINAMCFTGDGSALVTGCFFCSLSLFFGSTIAILRKANFLFLLLLLCFLSLVIQFVIIVKALENSHKTSHKNRAKQNNYCVYWCFYVCCL